jgi:mono/diheme cytochrome c family protein
LLSLGCAEQKMADQPRADPYESSPLFPDGRASRPPVRGTVARGQLREDPLLFEGRLAANPRARAAALFGVAGGGPLALAAVAPLRAGLADVFPFPVTDAVIDRGRQRFEIFCVVCHGPAGYGDGRIVERGYTRPPSYHIDRLRDAPVGHFFDVMTRGYGAMPSLASEVPVRDRWAIAAYLRVLQVSQNLHQGDLSDDERDRVRRGAKGGGDE